MAPESRYVLLSEVQSRAVGSMATARDRILGRVCVLKYAPMGSEDGRRLVAEGQALAGLSHPRLLRFHQAFEGVVPFAAAGCATGFAAEWVDGEPLGVAARQWSLHERLACFGGVLDAVGYLHRCGRLHLDLKPENILISERGPVLLDLGSSAHLDDSSLTGGTPDYAAPEVLELQAASELADIYSLGVILYELLTGSHPREHRGPFGQPAPVRALKPSTPRRVARLVEAMMEEAPAGRPTTIEVAVEALEAAGFARPASGTGQPPFFGRSEESAALRRVLHEDSSLVAVLGPQGSGRTRLVCEALDHFTDRRDARMLDLSEATDPVDALSTHCSGQRGGPWHGRVFLGDRSRAAPAVRAELDALARELSRQGVGLVWAAQACPPGARAFPVGPLGAPALEQIGRFAGVLGTDFARAVRTSGALPGPLLRNLGVTPELQAGSDEEAAQALRTLPDGIPPEVCRGLEPRYARCLRELLSAGLARRAAGGAVFLDGALPSGEIAPALGPLVAGIDPAHLPPTWAAVAFARLAMLDAAAALLPAVEADPDAPPAAVLELCQTLVEGGVRSAVPALARVRIRAGEIEAALELVRAAGGPEAALLEVRCLRFGGTLDDALAVARAHLERAPDEALWLEVASCALAKEDLDGAERACDSAAALAGAPTPAVLGLRVSVALRRVQQRQEVPGLHALLDAVADAEHLPGLSSTILSQCGRLQLRRGAHDRALVLLRRAAAAADREADFRAVAYTRLNLGNALMTAGDGRGARRFLGDAIQSARAIDQPVILLRALFSMAELELRCDRVASAERFVREYLEVEALLATPETAVRGKMLQGLLASRRGRPRQVLAEFEGLDLAPLSSDVSEAIALLRSRALLDLDDPEGAFAELQGVQSSGRSRDLAALRGRCLLALGRKELGRARAEVPDEPDVLDRVASGEVLLWSAGEDLDPDDLLPRRADLVRAAKLLRGDAMARAADLRDRILPGVGATLEGVVELLEGFEQPRDFPAALAKLVGEALGANRVLIMARIPGLGRRVTYTELTQDEVAGITDEVLSRIQAPDDVWLAGDVFSDPDVRHASLTVRTFRIRSVLAVAVPWGERAIGAIYVDDVHRANRFGDHEVALLQRIGRATAELLARLCVGPRGRAPAFEPEDVYGVLLTDPVRVQEIRAPLDMLGSGRGGNLLITGETGTGKTWFARRVATDVLGLAGLVEFPMRKMESDRLVAALAGTRRGEYTGAMDQGGRIMRALDERKALFIDEVQSLDDAGQATLLPLLEVPGRRFTRLNGTPVPLDDRLVVMLGSNVDVSHGRWREHFREDLWFRMSQMHVHLPCLSDRGPEVVYQYLARFLDEHGLPSPEEVLDASALDAFTSGGWPGNLRELRVAADRLAHTFRARGASLGLAEVTPVLKPPTSGGGTPPPAAPVHSPQVQRILALLPIYGFKQRDVAAHLGWSATKVSRALQREGLRGWVAEQRAREVRKRDPDDSEG